MTLARKLRAPSSRPRLGPAEDQLPILEREEEAEGEGKEQAPPEEVGKEPQVLQALERGQARVSQKVALGQDDAQLPSSPPEPERKSKKRKRKLKKYGKNVGKALQKGCRYLVLGLQGLANAYSSPLGVAVSVATAFR